MKYYLVYVDNAIYVKKNVYFFYSDVDKYGIATTKGAKVYSKKEAKEALKNDVPEYDYYFNKKINWKIVNFFTAFFYNLYDCIYNWYLDYKL